MFDAIRKHQRVLQFVLLILILPAFVFFGLSGYEGMLSADRGLASVAGRDVTQQEFDAAQRQQVEQLRQMLGDSVDAKMFDTPESRTEILEGLIAQKAIANEATARGLTVSDERLRQTILGIPGLRKDDGGFDDARYKALLSAQNLTPAGFEAQLRRDLMLQSLPEAIQSSAFVPATVRDRLVALQEERREIRELRFPASDFVAKVAPTDAQLQAYYEANGRQFETAETAKIEVVVLTRDALAAQVTVSPDDLKTYYEQNKARYGSPEERRASHILVKAGPDAKAKAEKLLEQVKADPGKFETLARTASDDPGSAAQGGDLGFFQRGMMVKPFADAVFEMKQGEIRGPIETEFGQHLIRLTGAKPSAEKPFEAVRAEIEREVRTQQAGAKYAEAAQSFTDMVYEQSDSLKPVADKWKLEIRTFDGVRRQPAPDAPKGSPIANARLLGAVFGDDALRNKRNTEAVEVAPGQLAAARVLEHRPAVRRPFDEVKDAVRTRLVAEESAKLAKQAGEARLAELKAAPANAAPAGFSAPITVSRNAPEGLAQPALEAVFRIPADPVPAYGGVDLGSQGFAVVQLVKIVPTSAEALAKRQSAYDPQLQRVAAQQDVVTYVDAIKARTKIVRHPDRIAGKATDASRQP
jgi:peptidyl-prolyl cis-trans isomerase D